ncbi:MAG TPA: ABC transporter ATP-binding protein [Solirubrobacteraceae bacterium]|nr:ABC transporter ATP-binding protein [Solirubrobacteraceae bacterium]
MRIFGKREPGSEGGRTGWDGEYAIEFRDVHKSYGGNRVLDGTTLNVPAGQITMLMGPSGTGKSVFVAHAIGLTRPDSGDVLVEGVSVPDLEGDELLALRKEKFGVLFQDGALFSSMSVLDNVAFPLRQNTDKSEEEILEIAHRRLAEVGLGGSGSLRPTELSGGMRKRVGFARALAMEPSIVFFDEPDSGLDPVRTALLCELIQEIHEDQGGTYVLVTHDMLSARRIGEHIALLWKGKVVADGPADELFTSDDPFVHQFLRGESRGPLGMD